jgi:outer membrane receptor for ferrienterochelin and colicins
MLIMITFLVIPIVKAQSLFVAYLKDGKTKEPIAGATAGIANTTTGNSADLNGLVVITSVPAGKQVIQYKALGYKPKEDTLNFPLPGMDTLVVFLEAEDEEMDEITVSTTRSSRSIKDIPTRIEFIAGEELDEKANMKPGDIRMILSESTGIQTLQTSATSGNSSIRIEGMDGRYTQMLKDGFPLYAGFSGGLGLLQTPPLDLKQVEIIKGSSSTLYGGGAIAGLVNLISKVPTKERELSFLINGTSGGGLDLNGFYGQRYGKTGLTIYAARNSNEPYDPSGNGLSAIPKFERYTINPRVFFYPNEKTEIVVGFNGSFENRAGGDMQYINGHGDSVHSYFEDNHTERLSSQLSVMHKFANDGKLSVKNSFDHFVRTIKMPGYTFDGSQNSTFTEASYSIAKGNLEWVTGANLFTDGFDEKQHTTVPVRNYTQTTAGAFIQNTWNVSPKLFVETGLRGDFVVYYGLAVLPRVSVLYKITPAISSRIGGGLGYKTPTIFTEESERIQYRNVLPISIDSNKLENSYGANWDVNYKTGFAHGKVTFSINQLVFYTHLDNPLLLTPTGGGLYHFQNIDGHIDARGAETNVKFGFKDFKLFLGYTYTYSSVHTGNLMQETPLTPRHHTNSVLMYEIEHKWKVGLEAYYYSSQKLSDGSTSRGYWLCGFMAERIWKKVSLFINFENFLDSRQTRYESIYTGSISNPVFRDIYAPLEGFVVNGGIKLKL